MNAWGFWSWKSVAWGIVLFLIVVLIVLFSGGHHAEFIYVDF